MQLTGHLRLCYPQLVWQRNYAGDAMDLFKAMDVPGVDRLDTPSVCQRLGTEDWQWQVEDKAAGQRVLDHISAQNPAVEIGYRK